MRTQQPIVSVVIPCLNRADYIEATLRSILEQEYPQLECLVADGGSTDGTAAIIQRYAERVRWHSELDGGPSEAINKSWHSSHGEILAWLNADDLWAPGAVQRAVDIFQANPDVDVVYGDCGVIDGKGRFIEVVHVRGWDLRYAVLLCDHIIYQPASFIRRTTLECVGWLSPELSHDHELWLRIAKAGGRFYHIPEVLGYVRDHAGNLSGQPRAMVPRKIAITQSFFDSPDIPADLHCYRARAVSQAYLRSIDFVLLGRAWFRDGNWRLCLQLAWRAFIADWTNVGRVLAYLLGIPLMMGYLAVRPWLPQPAKGMLRAMKRACLL